MCLANVATADPSAETLEISVGENYGIMTMLNGLLIEPRWNPYLDVEYQRGNVFASTQTGVGYKLINAPRFTGGFAMNYQNGRNTSSDSRYRGMGNVPAELAPSLFTEWKPLGDALDVYVEAGQSIGRNPSLYGTLEITAGFPITADVNGFIDLLGMGGSARYEQTFYGVTALQSERTNYPVYRPAGGVTQVTATTGIVYSYSSNWSVTVDVGARRYVGGAAESPLTSPTPRAVANIVMTYRVW